MTRRRRALNVTGVALAAAIGSSPMPSMAQTPDSATDLLQPSLEGNPTTPPRFRAPGETTPPSGNQSPPPGTFTAPSRIGAMPIYGSPTGFGAGDTGFDSLNRPRRNRSVQTPAPGGAAAPQPETTFTPVPTFASPAPAKPPATKKPPPAEIYPKKAATRTGAILPPPPDQPPLSNPPAEVHPLSAANRPGAVVPIPPPEYFDYSATPPPTAPLPSTLPLGTVPTRPLPIAATDPYVVLGIKTPPTAVTDPYAALGIRAGSFLLLPSLDLSGAYTTNPERVPGGSGSSYFVAAPELQVQSDWERHSLSADIAGSYTLYGADLIPSLNVPYLNSKIDGRIDVLRDTQVFLEQRVLVSTDNPGSPNLPAQLARLPINTDVGDTIGIGQEFNRLAVLFRGTFDRATYDASQLTDGTTSSNADRNFDQYAGILRAGYDLGTGLAPFVELQEDERIHDEEFDGLQRDSTGTTVKVGSAVDLFGSLTGAMAIGYAERSYKDPTLPDVSGVIADGSLIWQATALTTAKLTATSQVYETTLADASGELSRDVNLQVDHAFRRWLIGTLKIGYGNDDYVGSPLKDNRYFASVGLAYKLSRDLQIRTELRQDWLTATESGMSYTATSVLLGLRLQR
ncbi:MAG: outer membrane beta-barrel protein [Xanthobacteraceae bacterium]